MDTKTGNIDMYISALETIVQLFTVMGIFREMPQYRETLEEIVKSGRLTRSQDRPPDANKRELALIRIIRHFKHHYRSRFNFKIYMHCAME
jgi:hypothetical protein